MLLVILLVISCFTIGPVLTLALIGGLVVLGAVFGN